jgi:hypothetical protein
MYMLYTMKTKVTGVEFGIMNRRHHCRLTGNICVDSACNVRLPLPDLGYEEPERVSDPVLGMFSVMCTLDLFGVPSLISLSHIDLLYILIFD